MDFCKANWMVGQKWKVGHRSYKAKPAMCCGAFRVVITLPLYCMVGAALFTRRLNLRFSSMDGTKYQLFLGCIFGTFLPPPPGNWLNSAVNCSERKL